MHIKVCLKVVSHVNKIKNFNALMGNSKGIRQINKSLKFC